MRAACGITDSTRSTAKGKFFIPANLKICICFKIYHGLSDEHLLPMIYACNYSAITASHLFVLVHYFTMFD